jgi:GDP-4-dehydro-6-deoxy-D-mannose reductase
VHADPAKLRSADTLRLAGNGEKIFRELGWRPQIPLEQTLADLLAYWQQYLATNPAAAKSANEARIGQT